MPQHDVRRFRSSVASASISADGRFVAFMSYARLSAADRDSLALDRSAKTITLESASVDGRALNSDCSPPSISADGRYVAFETVLPDDTGRTIADIVLRDRVGQTARRITNGPAGTLSNGWSGQPVIDASAGAVVFASVATNLVRERDINGSRSDNVFIFDRTTGQISPVTGGRHGTWMEESAAPAIDATGVVVAFASRHPISARDVLNEFDLFVRSLSQ